MLTINARRRRPSPTFHKIVALATCTMKAALASAGLIAPVTAEEDRVQRPPYDRRALADIARDLLRRRASGANQSVAEPSLPARRRR